MSIEKDDYTKDELLTVAEAAGAEFKESDSKGVLVDAIEAATEDLTESELGTLVSSVLEFSYDGEAEDDVTEDDNPSDYEPPAKPEDYTPSLYELVTDKSGMALSYRSVK